MWAKHTQKGFTIVELLIVIVVIGVLASITVVAYNGIQNRANDAAVQSDLRTAGNKILQFQATEGYLPALLAELDSLGLSTTQSAYGGDYIPIGSPNSHYNFIYCKNGTGNSAKFAVVASSKSGNVFAYRSQGGLVGGAGPLTTFTTTCANQGVPANGIWGYLDNNWQDWTK